MNPFKAILDQIIGSLQKSPESVVGIDIGSCFIKVVQVRKKGAKAVLETYGSIALGPYDDLPDGGVTNLSVEKISEALLALMKEANVSTKNAALAMSSSASLIFILRIPGIVDEGKLPSIVPLEARKYIPVPIDEVSLDWFLVPKDSYDSQSSLYERSKDSTPDENEVLVTATHLDTVKKYQDIVLKSSLASSLFEIEVFSNARASLKHDLLSVALIDIGALRTRLSIMERGVVKSFHIINRGSADMTNEIMRALGVTFEKAEEMKIRNTIKDDKENRDLVSIVRPSLDYIFSEASNAILAYEKSCGKTVSKAILSGGGSMMSGMTDFASAKFNFEVVLSDPFSKVESPAFLSEVLKNIGPQFGIALGMALRKLS